jgi:hypothetical protein
MAIERERQLQRESNPDCSVYPTRTARVVVSDTFRLKTNDMENKIQNTNTRKFTLKQATKNQNGSRCVAVLFL